MHIKTKSALAAFLVMAIAFIALYLFDYTDNYVGNRFERAVESRRPSAEETFSLDGLIGYYDWDSVCLVLPETEHAFKTRLGLEYKHKDSTPTSWSLVFLKGKHVETEIQVEQAFLGAPEEFEDPCFNRWSAIFGINVDENGHRYLFVTGH